MWFNMREEVLVYVKGRPLVLREDERPFKNMQVNASFATLMLALFTFVTVSQTLAYYISK